MTKKNLKDISSKMKNLDLCMMTTQSESGQLSSRPMSNNGDVEYDGNSYFFTYEKSTVVKDIQHKSQVNLSFKGKDDLFLSLEGKGVLIKNKAELEKHWIDELKQWFKEGIETPGIIMIHIKAHKIKYWHKMEMEEVTL